VPGEKARSSFTSVDEGIFEMEDIAMEMVSTVPGARHRVARSCVPRSHALLCAHAQEEQGPSTSEKDAVCELVNEVQRIRRDNGVGSPEVKTWLSRPTTHARLLLLC